MFGDSLTLAAMMYGLPLRPLQARSRDGWHRWWLSAAPSISVPGTPQALTLTAADLGSMPRATATTNNNGIATTYEGVWLSDVLKKAGAAAPDPASAAPHSPRTSWRRHLMAIEVVFSVGEVDPEMTDGQFPACRQGKREKRCSARMARSVSSSRRTNAALAPFAC